MQKLLILTLLLSTHTLYAKQHASPCAKLALYEKAHEQSKEPAKVLFQLGKLAEEVEKKAPVEIEAYKKDPNYKNICHYKIVRSENFGDFPSYSGYHYFQILKQYPDSDLVDDAAFALIYVITEDTYNFSDTRIEKGKLEQFLEHYPKSNKAKEARTRIREIEDALKNGEPPILD